MNAAKFFASVRSDPRLGAPKLTQAQVDVAQAIIAKGAGLRLPALAYVLATAWHEAKLTPRRENMNYTTTAQLRKVWPTRFPTTASAQPFVRNPVKLANHVYGDRLGNRAGTNDGWDFRGGGLDQLTGRDHYTRQGIADNPDAILRPDMAVASLVSGMTLGRYRGHKLADFFTATSTNFVGARAIINADVNRVGLQVSRYADAFKEALEAAGYNASAEPVRAIPVTDASPAQPNAATSGGPVIVAILTAIGLVAAFIGLR